MLNRRGHLTALAAAAALSVGSLLPSQVFAQETIKVGVLHSLSGTMAISETVLKDTVLMAIDEINAKGGVLGKKLEPVVVDPASNWPLFAEKTKQLLTQDKVSVIFGCWTSVSRKSVLPVVEELNGLLFYPVQYEGEELSKNVFYTGAAPNQQAIPAVDYLMSKDGGSAKRWVLLGTDYVYPRTTNKILRAESCWWYGGTHSRCPTAPSAWRCHRLCSSGNPLRGWPAGWGLRRCRRRSWTALHLRIARGRTTGR